jgi:hypothetical protein
MAHYAELIERTEAEGWAERHLAVSPEFQTRFGTSVRRYGSAVALVTRHADIPALNRVFALGLKEPLTVDTLDRIVADFREAGVRRIVVHWSPMSVPSEAPAWLTERGFHALRRMAMLLRRTECAPTPPTALGIVEVDDSAAEVYEQIVAPGNGLPVDFAPHVRSTLGDTAWRHYLAFDGERPVAGAALFARGNVAWCAGSATLPSDQRRGAQSALLARRVRDAALMGCEWIVAETLEETETEGNPSYRNMRRVGFDLAYLRASYLLTLGANPGDATSPRLRIVRPRNRRQS